MARAASSRARRLTPAQVKRDRKWGTLLRGELPGFDPCHLAGGCYFDIAAAEDVLEFFPTVLRHAKPPVSGQPFELGRWQASWLANFFAWKRPDGRRRFKTTFLYVPKKNTKTELVAGVVLYVMARAPDGAELYAAAASQKQAGEIAEFGFGMIRKHDELNSRFVPYGGKGGTVSKSIMWHERMISFKVLQADADTVDGVGPYLVAIDELHRHPDGELASVLVKGTRSQREPIIIYTSTADHDRESPCNTLLKRARSVRDNHGDKNRPGYDPTFLPALWEAKKEDDWTDLAVWRRVNPNFGVSITEETAREEIQLAKESPGELNDVLRLCLNIVVGVAGGWLNMPKWDKASPRLVLVGQQRDSWVKDLGLVGRRCFLGIDLGKTSDLTSVASVFPPESAEEDWIVLMRYWMPEEKVDIAERRDRVPLLQWVDEGWLIATEGDVMDYAAVREFIFQAREEVDIQGAAYDPWNAMQLALELKDAGIEVAEFRQGPRSYNEACHKVVDLISAKRLAHGGNPVLRWNASNVVVKKDENGNISPSKKRSTGRIDGISALCMGVGMSILNQLEQHSLDAAYKQGEGIYL